MDGSEEAPSVDAGAKVDPRNINGAELRKRFTYHPPKGDQQARYERIRDEAHQFAATIVSLCPQSRETSLALTNLEQTVMWANAAIARRS